MMRIKLMAAIAAIALALPALGQGLEAGNAQRAPSTELTAKDSAKPGKPQAKAKERKKKASKKTEKKAAQR